MAGNYIENPFSEGQEVMCISEDFPCIIATGEDKSGMGAIPPHHPKKWEKLCIDEILGEYLRFEKYDIPTSYNWWKHTRFKAIEEMTEEDVVEKNVELFYELRRVFKK